MANRQFPIPARWPLIGSICLGVLVFFMLPFAGAGQSYVPEKGNRHIRVRPVVPVKAYAFDLGQVRVLNGPFRHAMDLDSGYLLSLDADRLLHRFYTNAGLPDKGKVYGGWESEGLSGHTLGHYLSACAMMYASTREESFRKRVDYIVAELFRCQQARGSGYVGAIPGEDSIFGKVARGEIRSGGFDLNGGWSPWYTVHKLMAGLCDAYLYCDNQTALKVVEGMADWAYAVVEPLPDSLRLKMLYCEYGGMNDVLAQLYAITAKQKYLDLSRKFHDEFVLGKLARQIDPMPGKHSNTNVPKAIGCATRYELTGNKDDSTIAAFFWHSMVEHHSYVIGGNSNYEYCGKEDELSDRLSDNTCETCNTYNMLKLTRHLFAWQPDGRLMDFYERALYNHILASQNPENGMMCYFVPLRMGTRKSFSDSFNTFTCCVGSGMENHSKYAEQIYSHDGANGVFVNLFIPSQLNWKARGVTLTQITPFPDSGYSRIVVETGRPKQIAVHIRIPGWCGNDFQIRGQDAAGRQIKMEYRRENGYAMVNRTFQNGDELLITMGMRVYTESMPDNPNRIAIKYGPLVLAGELGGKKPDPVYGTPVLMTANTRAADWIRRIPGSDLQFQMTGVGKPFDVKLAPFYKIYRQYYSVYWDFFTPQQWADRQEAYEAEKMRNQAIEAATIDYFRIGEMQTERDHRLQASERSYVSDALGVMGREARAGHYFEFDMEVNPAGSNYLLLTYIGDDRDRQFDILVNHHKIATVNREGGQTGVFYHELYAIPRELLTAGNRIRVRIEANYGKTAGRVFGARTLKRRL